jgi:hypothetical protein
VGPSEAPFSMEVPYSKFFVPFCSILAHFLLQTVRVDKTRPLTRGRTGISPAEICWLVGLLVCWYVGMLVRWYVGTFIRGSVGPWVRGSVGVFHSLKFFSNPAPRGTKCGSVWETSSQTQCPSTPPPGPCRALRSSFPKSALPRTRLDILG